jgi:hypothetical protein
MLVMVNELDGPAVTCDKCNKETTALLHSDMIIDQSLHIPAVEGMMLNHRLRHYLLYHIVIHWLWREYIDNTSVKWLLERKAHTIDWYLNLGTLPSVHRIQLLLQLKAELPDDPIYLSEE